MTRLVDLASVRTPAHLRELAWQLEQRQAFDDPGAAADDLVAICERGSKPGLGFYRRHVRRPALMPVSSPEPIVYVRACRHLFAAGFDESFVALAIVGAATANGLDDETAALAAAKGIAVNRRRRAR